MNKERMLYSLTEIDSDFIGNTPDKIVDGLNEGTNYINYDFKNHRYLITFISDNFNAFDKIEEDRKKNKQVTKPYRQNNKLLLKNTFYKCKYAKRSSRNV